MNNEYQSDGLQFLRRTSQMVSDNMTTQEVVEATLFFALGAERILKSILFRVNPIYIYKTPEFKNTVPILYHNLIKVKSDKELAGSPDHDVLTFRQSLSRAKLFSPTTSKHVSLLFSLSNFRDIIVHNVISTLDIGKVHTLLLRDFYVLIKDYQAELNLTTEDAFGPNHRMLASLSIAHQDSVKDRLELKLDFHRRQWERFSEENPEFAARMSKRTESVKNKYENKNDGYIEEIDCPACANIALITIEMDYDYSDGQVTATGAFVSDLQCMYCQLKIDEYDEMDALKLDEMLWDQEAV